MKPPASIVLALPQRDTTDIKRLRARVQAAALDAGASVRTFRAVRGDVAGEAWQRPVQFLEPGHAYQLYKLLHRTRALVVAFTRIYVRRDPNRQPAVRREALELGDFLAHKAQFSLIRGDSSVDEALQRFAHWLNTVDCLGEDDPRSLPLHVFTTERPWPELSSASGRASFVAKYGRPRSRVDDGDKRWVRSQRGAYHGLEALTVAGCELPPGLHWDVAPEVRNARLASTHEIWKLSGSRGYVNAYPDGYVRKTQRSSARCVWKAS